MKVRNKRTPRKASGERKRKKSRSAKRLKQDSTKQAARETLNLGLAAVSITPDLIEQASREAPHTLLSEQLGWETRSDCKAFEAFDWLVKKGCDSIFLFAMLSILYEAHRLDTWNALYGFSGRKPLQTALKRLRKCGEDVKKLLKGSVCRAFSERQSLTRLPRDLDALTAYLGEMTRSITPNRNIIKRAALGAIVKHVTDRTGGPRDTLVADMLTPTLGLYHAVAQCAWRHDNALLIRTIKLSQT